jgi:hypothetical protein
MVIIPSLWPRLRETERWQIGQSYAEVSASGNRNASAGLKKSLIDVHGFDFVPETLRSSTFTEAAARVLSAHFAYNNFYNEEEPMRVLANLGTAIPMPAFAKCMEAILAVRLGNHWGRANSAQPAASQLLEKLRPTQWAFYFNECLRRDRTVLDKLALEAKPVANWCDLVKSYNVESTLKDQHVKDLLDASRAGNSQRVMTCAMTLRSRIGS